MALQWLLLTGGPDSLTGPLTRPGGASRDSGVTLQNRKHKLSWSVISAPAGGSSGRLA